MAILTPSSTIALTTGPVRELSGSPAAGFCSPSMVCSQPGPDPQSRVPVTSGAAEPLPHRDLDTLSLDVGLDGPFSVLSLIPTPATAYTHPTHAGTHKGTHSPCTRVFWARFHPPVTGVCEVQTDTPHDQPHPPGCDRAACEALTRPLNHRTAGRAHFHHHRTNRRLHVFLLFLFLCLIYYIFFYSSYYTIYQLT